MQFKVTDHVVWGISVFQIDLRMYWQFSRAATVEGLGLNLLKQWENWHAWFRIQGLSVYKPEVCTFSMLTAVGLSPVTEASGVTIAYGG